LSMNASGFGPSVVMKVAYDPAVTDDVRRFDVFLATRTTTSRWWRSSVRSWSMRAASPCGSIAGALYLARVGSTQRRGELAIDAARQKPIAKRPSA